MNEESLYTRIFMRDSGSVKTSLPKQLAQLYGWSSGTRIKWLLVGGFVTLRPTQDESGGNVSTIYALREGQLIITIPKAIAGLMEVEGGSRIEWRAQTGEVTVRRA